MNRAQLYLRDRRRIQRALKLSDQEYCQAQYEAGLEYLRKFCLGLNIYDTLERSRTFWQWFINQWHIHDYQWLAKMDDDYEIELEYHDAKHYAKHHLCVMFRGETVKIYPGTELIDIAKKEVQNARP